MTFHYPNIDPDSIKNLKIAAALAREHKSYFLESPYSSAVEEVIMAYLGKVEAPKKGSPGVEAGDEVFKPSSVSDSSSKWDVLLSESEALYNRLKLAGTGTSNDGTEAMSYFRTATSLLEKIVGLRERAMGLKQVHEFQQTVLEVMDSVLDATQRTAVMEKLKNAIGE